MKSALTRRLSGLFPARPRAAPLSNADLICKFESIGDNCEFGTIQRCCGAEPFSLLRFTFSLIENLIDVLKTDAAHFFTEDDLEIFQWPDHDEHIFRSKHYQDFGYHTYRTTKEISADDIRSEEVKKIAYLKDGFIDDLRSGEKIYVRKGRENLGSIERLHEALNRHGPNSLLWVVPATKTHPRGTLEVLKNGLYRGYIAKYKDFSKDEPTDLESWVAICKKAYAKHSALRQSRLGSRPSAVTFAKNKVIASGNVWTIGPACKEDPAKSPLYAKRLGAKAKRLTFQRDTPPLEPIASHEISINHVKPRSIIVFAAWVWIPDHFGGFRLDAWFVDLPVIYSHGADLSRRNTWQKVWISAKIPRGPTTAVVAIRAAGLTGSSVHLSSWSLEEGTVPSGPTRPTRLRDAPIIEHPPLRALTRLLAPRDLDERIRQVKEGGRVWLTFRRTAEAVMAANRFDEADGILTQALAAFPNDRTFLQLYAGSADDSGRAAVAGARWKAALDATPHNPVFVTGYAASLRRQGLVEAAAGVITDALRHWPLRGATLAEAARIAEAQIRNDDALALWEKAVDLDEVDADWLHGHALALARLGRVDEARKATLIAVAAHPRHRNLVALQRHFSSLDRRRLAATPST